MKESCSAPTLMSACNDTLISSEEVAKHAGVDDCWIIISGNVYDVTSFKDSHPGGKDIIETHAGKDCTLEFESIGHSPDALGKMMKLKVGRHHDACRDSMQCEVNLWTSRNPGEYAVLCEVLDDFDTLTKSQVPTPLTPLAQELDALRARLVAETKADNGRADRRHLAKIHAARWLCLVAGLGSAWMCVNPGSAFLISMFRFVSWAMCAHHILHRGYDGVPGIPVQWTSARYARGWRRWIDWPDWIWPDAWIQEHNTLHHYKLCETHDPANYHVALGDPDLVEFNLEWLRKSSAPWPLKYLYIFVMACIWKFLYYAPNTLHAWLLKKDPARRLPKALDLAFVQPFGPTGRMLWAKCYLPYVTLNFVAVPAAFSLISHDAARNVLLNMLVAEVLTNLHAFVTIVTNHAGDDLHRFSEPLSPQMTRHDFYCRQIMGSVNFPCGNDLIDTMHGYLNYQIEHHLWPDMTMLQYRKAQPLVKALAAKYGVSYVQESALLRTLKTVRIMAGVSSQKRLPNTVSIGRAPQ